MAKKDTKGITVKKKDDFSEWYTQVVTKSELADYTSVSGCIVFRPDSYEIWEKLRDVCDKKFKNLGVRNAYFPLFIPENLLNKEARHVEGFSPEVAWVTHGGNTKLGERLAIRPTSEAIMYDSYAKWIRSWRDLPLKINQWNAVVRWEFKYPTPFLRTREFLWNEGHTVFASKKEALKEEKQIIKIYYDFLKDYMALPGLIGRKSEKEKFAGAEFTTTIELYLDNGKAIQGPDFHYDGQNFAKAYNIKFLNKDGKKEYVWQNTWAISTRMLGVMIAIHGDDKGLVLPPKLAPRKVVIVPIIDKRGEVIKKAKELGKKLKKYNVILDDREDYSPGWKFNEWELKGIPIRIEIGPKDLAKKQVVLVRRDTGKKQNVKLGGLVKIIDKELKKMQEEMYKKAEKKLYSNIVEVKTLGEMKKAIKNKKIVKAPWCGGVECEDWIKDKLGGVKSLNTPLKREKLISSKCFHCGKKARYNFYFGKSY